ncbi:MAG: cohesin domain-containing protein [Planctomycetota bacterium]|jgi:hypothetical protein
MKKVVPILLLILCCGCSTSMSSNMMEDRAMPRAAKGTAAMEREVHDVIEVWLENATGPLGAYHLEVHYNPEVVQIDSITSAQGGGFNVSPVSSKVTYSSGLTGIVGILPGSEGPPGKVLIARVTFRHVASGTSRVSVSIKSLYNPESKPINGAVSISKSKIIVP